MAFFGNAARRAAGLTGSALLAFANASSARSKVVTPPTVPIITPAAPGFEVPYQTPRDFTGKAEASRSFEALFGKISTNLGPSNPRWTTFNGEMKPETITGAIDEANAGLPFRICDMYRRAIEQDAHLGGVVSQAFSSIIASGDRIDPPRHLARDVCAVSLANWLRAVREQVEDFDNARFALLWAEGQGYASAEVIYGYRRIIWHTASGQRISREYCVPVKLEIVEGRSFRFDTQTDEPLLWLEGDFIPLPPAKFIFHRARGFTSVIERRGFMRSCIYLHAMKQWDIRDMAEYLHQYGIPQMIAEYDPKQYKYEAARAVARTVMEYLGQGGIPTVPIDQFRLRSDTPPPQWALVHKDAAEFLNGEMTKIVTLGPLTMESSGGSYGLGGLHAEGAFNGQVQRAKNLCDSIRSGMWIPTVGLNVYRLARDIGYPPEDVVSVISRYEPQMDRDSDPEKRQGVYSQAMRDGCPVSLSQYRGELNLDAPKNDGDTLKGEATPIPSAGATASAVDASEGVEAPLVGKAPAAKTESGGGKAPPKLNSQARRKRRSRP